MGESEFVKRINSYGADETMEMVRLFQSYVEEQLSAINVTWMASYQKPYGRNLWHVNLMNNWKVVDAIFPTDDDKDYAKEYKAYFKQALDQGGIDPYVIYVVQHAGRTRVDLLEKAVSLEEWQQHWMYQYMQTQGAGDRLAGSFTLSETAESHFTIDRAVGQPIFNQQDADYFYHLLKQCPKMHYWLFLERGLVEPALKPLSPRLQEVLMYLLGPLSEKDISEKVQLTTGSLHNYVMDIYKNFQVSSRYQLMQLWLKQVPNLY